MGKLFVIDVATGEVTKAFDTPDIPVLRTPGEFAVAPNGENPYVSCPQGATIEIVNLKEWEAGRTYSTHQGRRWHGLGSFGRELGSFRYALTAKWSVTWQTGENY